MNRKNLIVGGVVLLLLVAAFLVYKVILRTTSLPQSSYMSGRNRGTDGLLDKAKKAMSEGNFDEAVDDLKTLITEQPGSNQAEKGSFMLASVYEKRNDLLKAKETYQEIIEKFPASNNVANAQEALDKINISIIFSPVQTKNSLSYEVQKGDTLNRIAKKFNTTADIISKANNLKGNYVIAGQKLRVYKGRFSIVVDKSQNILTLKSNGEIIRTYRVSTGKDFCTPVGTFKVTNKIVNPQWYPSSGGVIPSGDPRNVLGSRWLGLSKEGYGIHGTTDPASIGKNVTEGCVRMLNYEVEELYSIIPEGTEVVIVD